MSSIPKIKDLNIDYDMVSPISGKKAVFVEETDNRQTYMDMSTGYVSYDTLLNESDEQQHIEKSMPSVVIENKFIDDSGIVWYPCHMNLMNLAVMYPEPTEDKDGINYTVAEIIQKEDGESYISEGQTFEMDNFEMAYDYLRELVVQKAHVLNEQKNNNVARED